MLSQLEQNQNFFENSIKFLLISYKYEDSMVTREVED